MKKVEVAYCAGLFDGEGCIRIAKYKKGRASYNLKCLLEMANEYIPQLFKFHFGGGVYSKKRIINGKPYFATRWEISTRVASNFLEVVLPYLKLKKAEAELGIKFAKGIHSRKGRTRILSDEELVLREADFILMKSMKGKGQGAKGQNIRVQGAI